MNEKIHIQHGSVQETLIIPLYARKKCSDKFPALYSDPMASEISSRLDYDFSSLDKKYENALYQFGALEGAMRQMDMMWEISDYLKTHPRAAIVCMGCGLDFDPRRCGNENTTIYNLDFPDVIAARQELVPKDPREVNLAVDLTDLSWMDQVQAPEGAVFYAAGVFYYLKKEDVRKIALGVADRYPGARLLFDCVGQMGYKLMMKSVLREHGMEDLGNWFYSEAPVQEFSAWSDRIRVSVRGYMLGYYDMKAPGVRGIHRFLAKVADRVMKMLIVRMDMP